MAGRSGSLKAVLYALSANSGIALAKAGAAAYTGSAALFAEAIHSLADCANQVLLLIGMRQAVRPESEDHPNTHSIFSGPCQRGPDQLRRDPKVLGK
jgi:divalent metal cation (Fe/Co/Zn/Cd) transporter